MARLKSPQTSQKETESSSQEWVLPITSEAEVAPKSDKIKESDNNDSKSSLEVAENSKLSMCPTARMTGTETKEKWKEVYGKIKHDAVKVAVVVSSETETCKEDSVDSRLILFLMGHQFKYFIIASSLSSL